MLVRCQEKYPAGYSRVLGDIRHYTVMDCVILFQTAIMLREVPTGIPHGYTPVGIPVGTSLGAMMNSDVGNSKYLYRVSLGDHPSVLKR